MIGTGTTVLFGIVERFPAPVEERTGRRVYAPMQWWPLRVMNPWHKAGFLVSTILGGGSLASSAYLVFPAEPVHVVWSVVATALVIVLARSFRGRGEPVDPPRPWWRLTAFPRASWWLGVLYLVSTPAVFATAEGAGDVMDAITSLFFAAAFLNCAARLTFSRART